MRKNRAKMREDLLNLTESLNLRVSVAIRGKRPKGSKKGVDLLPDVANRCTEDKGVLA
jgi:hypothetical protein